MKTSYHIGEIAEYFGVSTDTLRLYERKGLISPRKEANGYRSYSREDMIFLDYIIKLRRIGMPISEIKQLVCEGQLQDIARVVEVQSRKLFHRLEELQALYAATKDYSSILKQTIAELDQIYIGTSPRMIIRLIGDSEGSALAAFDRLGGGFTPFFCTLTAPHDILAEDDRFNIYNYHVRNSALTNAIVVIDRENAIDIPKDMEGEFLVCPPRRCVCMAASCHSQRDYEAFVRLRRFVLDHDYTAAGDMICVFVALRCRPQDDDYYQTYLPIR